MTNDEQMVLTVINGLQDANQDWRVFKKDAKKTEAREAQKREKEEGRPPTTGIRAGVDG